MPCISIIIPVYNIACYLRQCLLSVVNQTLRDIEIIIIDDGSTDESAHICDEFAKNDDRIVVVHRLNEGLSSARNAGIDMAKAPYVLFVDGDDWIELDLCEKVYDIAKANKADLVLFTYTMFFCKNRKKQTTKTGIPSGKLTEKQAIDFNIRYSLAVWLGLYHRNIVSHVRFPDGKYHEDTGVSHRLIHAADCIYLTNDALYNYRIGRSGSIMSNPTTKEHPDLREMLYRKIDDLQSWGYKGYAQMLAFRMLEKYGCKRDEQKLIVDIVKRINGFGPKTFSWRQRMLLIVYRISPALFDMICETRGIRIKW